MGSTRTTVGGVSKKPQSYSGRTPPSAGRKGTSTNMKMTASNKGKAPTRKPSGLAGQAQSNPPKNMGSVRKAGKRKGPRAKQG